MAQTRCHSTWVTKYVFGKQHRSKKKTSCLVDSWFWWAFCGLSQFPRQPAFKPSWITGCPLRPLSQACSNWRGKMQFTTVNSGNKYSISHKNITDTTKDLVLLPNASCCQQKFLNRILHVVANTSGKIIYMCVLHLVYYFTCRKDVRTQKHYNHPYTPKYWVLTICLPQI